MKINYCCIHMPDVPDVSVSGVLKLFLASDIILRGQNSYDTIENAYKGSETCIESIKRCLLFPLSILHQKQHSLHLA